MYTNYISSIPKSTKRIKTGQQKHQLHSSFISKTLLLSHCIFIFLLSFIWTDQKWNVNLNFFSVFPLHLLLRVIIIILKFNLQPYSHLFTHQICTEDHYLFEIFFSSFFSSSNVK